MTPQVFVSRVHKVSLSLLLLVSVFLLIVAANGGATRAQTGDTTQTGPIYTVNSTAHPGDGACTTGNCTLLEAVTAANTTPNGAQPDQIHFNIAGCSNGTCTITFESPLPDIGEAVVIDGLTQPGMNGTCPLHSGNTLTVSLDGYWNMSSAPEDQYRAFHITGGGSTIRGLNMTNFGDEVIQLTSGNNHIECNHIGPVGEITYYNRNFLAGILITGSNNVIGGAGLGNVIVHGRRGGGVEVTGTSANGNIIQGNRIGLTVADGCGYNDGAGIRITDSSANLIGGTRPELRNVVSCNDKGILILGSQALHNVIQGNYIGLNATGQELRGNGGYAIDINSLSTSNLGTLIGGDEPGARNVIAAHYETIIITGATTDVPSTATPTRIIGNYIGTNQSGTQRLGSGNGGILLTNLSNVVVASNLVSGSFFRGIGVTSSRDFIIRSNIIGSDITGTLRIGNNWGISLYSPPGSEWMSGVIGGDNPSDANLIRFNDYGIVISGSGTRIARNIITDSRYSGIAAETLRLRELRYQLRIMRVSASSIDVVLTDLPNTRYRVEVFANSVCSPSGNGEGLSFVGFVDVTTDGAGLAQGTLSYTPVSGQNVFAATVTVENTYSSGFSECFTYTPTADVTATPFGLMIGRESSRGESRVGMNYQQRYSVTSPFIPVSLTADPVTLPPGLAFANNMLTGVPTEAGTFSVTFEARDALNHTVVQTFDVYISPAYVIAPETLPGGRVNNRYEQSFEILNGYRSDFRLRVIDGSLPPGVTYQNFGLVGIPTQAGSFTFTIGWGQDSYWFVATAQRTYTITILENPIIIEPEILPVIDYNAFYDQTIVVAGGTPPYSLTMTSGTLPPGIMFDAVSGRISGRVQGYAYHVVVIRATDSTGIYNERTYILTVENVPTGTPAFYSSPTPTATATSTETSTPTATLTPLPCPPGAITVTFDGFGNFGTAIWRVTNNRSVDALFVGFVMPWINRTGTMSLDALWEGVPHIQGSKLIWSTNTAGQDNFPPTTGRAPFAPPHVPEGESIGVILTIWLSRPVRPGFCILISVHTT